MKEQQPDKKMEGNAGIKMVELEQVCVIKNGYAFKSEEYKSEGVPLLRISNFNDGDVLIDEDTVFLDSEYLKSKSDFIVEKGDILIALSGATTGKYGFYNYDYPSLLNQRVGLLKSGTSKKLHERYFYHFLNILKGEILRNAGGAAQPNISTNAIGKFQIPLPPLETQQKIAAILDAADAYRQKTKALVEKYDQLAQSLFLEMFGDLKGQKGSLELFCELNPKKSEIANLEKDMFVSFVPMANVSDKGEVALNEKRRIAEVWNGFTYFKENDVVFAKITPCMENGKGAIMKNLKNGIGFGSTEFHVLRPLENISNSTWLYFLTFSDKFRIEAEKNMTGSAGQKRVPIDFIRKYQVVCPSLSLQNQFAERIQQIEAQKQQVQTSLQKAETLFNSLLQKAFNGGLVN